MIPVALLTLAGLALNCGFLYQKPWLAIAAGVLFAAGIQAAKGE